MNVSEPGSILFLQFNYDKTIKASPLQFRTKFQFRYYAALTSVLIVIKEKRVSNSN